MSLDGFDSLKRKVEHMKRDLQDEVDDAVQEGLTTTKREAQDIILTEGRSVTGELLTSWVQTQRSIPGGVTHHRLANIAPYAVYVEFGTGARFGTSPFSILETVRPYKAPPHTPALTRAIRRWVRTKPTFFGPRTDSVAFRIAESISELGTHPHPFLRPSWGTVSGPMAGVRRGSPLDRKLRAAVSRVVKRS